MALKTSNWFTFISSFFVQIVQDPGKYPSLMIGIQWFTTFVYACCMIAFLVYSAGSWAAFIVNPINQIILLAIISRKLLRDNNFAIRVQEQYQFLKYQDFEAWKNLEKKINSSGSVDPQKMTKLFHAVARRLAESEIFDQEIDGQKLKHFTDKSDFTNDFLEQIVKNLGIEAKQNSENNTQIDNIEYYVQANRSQHAVSNNSSAKWKGSWIWKHICDTRAIALIFMLSITLKIYANINVFYPIVEGVFGLSSGGWFLWSFFALYFVAELASDYANTMTGRSGSLTSVQDSSFLKDISIFVQELNKDPSRYYKTVFNLTLNILRRFIELGMLFMVFKDTWLILSELLWMVTFARTFVTTCINNNQGQLPKTQISTQKWPLIYPLSQMMIIVIVLTYSILSWRESITWVGWLITTLHLSPPFVYLACFYAALTVISGLWTNKDTLTKQIRRITGVARKFDHINTLYKKRKDSIYQSYCGNSQLGFLKGLCSLFIEISMFIKRHVWQVLLWGALQFLFYSLGPMAGILNPLYVYGLPFFAFCLSVVDYQTETNVGIQISSKIPKHIMMSALMICFMLLICLTYDPIATQTAPWVLAHPICIISLWITMTCAMLTFEIQSDVNIYPQIQGILKAMGVSALSIACIAGMFSTAWMSTYAVGLLGIHVYLFMGVYYCCPSNVGSSDDSRDATTSSNKPVRSNNLTVDSKANLHQHLIPKVQQFDQITALAQVMQDNKTQAK